MKRVSWTNVFAVLFALMLGVQLGCAKDPIIEYFEIICTDAGCWLCPIDNGEITDECEEVDVREP